MTRGIAVCQRRAVTTSDEPCELAGAAVVSAVPPNVQFEDDYAEAHPDCDVHIMQSALLVDIDSDVDPPSDSLDELLAAPRAPANAMFGGGTATEGAPIVELTLKCGESGTGDGERAA